MYKRFKAIDERNKRMYMAGLSLAQMAGFKSVREFCSHTVLLIADIDLDEILYFSNSIGHDTAQVDGYNGSKYTGYTTDAVAAYVDDEYKEGVARFLSIENLRESFERGLMSDSMEYLCHTDGIDMWIRACFELEQIKEDHVQVTVILIDVSRLHEGEALAAD